MSRMLSNLLPIILSVTVFSFVMPALASKPAYVVPVDSTSIVERLPTGYAALMPTRAHSSPLAQAAQLLEMASRSGDARLSARAEALLARFPADNASPTLLRLRAYAAQHRHDFAAAQGYLDRLIAIDPRDADARLSRAQIHLVQGRLDLARTDCIGLASGVDVSRGLLCVAALDLRRGHYRQSSDLVDRWLAQSQGDAALHRYAIAIRADAAMRDGAEDAERWFDRLAASAPNHVRTRIAHAVYLRRAGRAREAFASLIDAPDSDGVHLQRALAAQAAGMPQAGVLIEAQARRYRLARSLGAAPELRDEAEFLLMLRKQPRAALEAAQRNFETQRDEEDVRILRFSAVAAGRPEALASLNRWAKRQGLKMVSIEGSQP